MKFYVVAYTHFDYETGKPKSGALKTLFKTDVAAESAIKKNAAHYCNLYNRSHGDAKPFRWDIDGSEEFDYVIRFWDGDDYRLVTGYEIFEVNAPEKRNSKREMIVEPSVDTNKEGHGNSSDKLWHVPVEWSVSAIADVYAPTLAEAMDAVLDPAFPLPQESYYLEESFAIANVDENYIRNVHNNDQPDAEEEGADDEC